METKKTISKQRIDEIIQEEVLSSNILEEGFFSRINAKASGNVSALAQMGKNVGAVFNAVTKGDVKNIKDPRVVKALTAGLVRIKSYDKKVGKLVVDMASDLKIMFGEHYENMPDALKQRLAVLGEETKDMLDLLKIISNDVEQILKGEQKNG